MNHYITEIAWVKILQFLKTKKNIYVKSAEKCRLFLEAMHWMMRSGAQWRLLPYYYGKWNSVFDRFNEWCKKNIWGELMQYCIIDPDLEYVLIDASIIRAHACAAGYEKDQQEREGLGRSKGGFTTKIHIATDALGNPLKIIITSGQTSDITKAPELVKNISARYALADKGYDSDEFRELLKQQDCVPVIPGRSHRKIAIEIDMNIYAERNAVECFFSKIKQFRRIFSRFDKSIRNFLSFISFGSAIIWLLRFNSEVHQHRFIPVSRKKT